VDSIAPKKQKNCIPNIAFAFALAPLLWLSIYVSIPGFWIFLALFLVSYFGILLQIVGLILGMIALHLMTKRKNADIRGVIFSIVAIIAPFVWVFILFRLEFVNYIMSYK